MQLLAHLARTEAAVLAPRLLLEEVGNTLLTGIRRGRWSGERADESFLLLRRLPISLIDDPRDLDRAWDLARRYDAHPLYDMLYAAVALQRGEQLITADAPLRRRLAGTGAVVSPAEYLA